MTSSDISERGRQAAFSCPCIVMARQRERDPQVTTAELVGSLRAELGQQIHLNEAWLRKDEASRRFRVCHPAIT